MENEYINPETYVFNFGKYEGETYEDVLEKDMRYIRWCHEWVEWFKISPEEEERLREMTGLTLVQFQLCTPPYERRIYSPRPPSGTGGYAEEAEMWFGSHNCYGI